MTTFGIVSLVFGIIFGTIIFIIIVQFSGIVWELFKADKE